MVFRTVVVLQKLGGRGGKRTVSRRIVETETYL